MFNLKRLQNQLATGKMKLVSGSVAGDIVIDTSLTWVSANTLTLDAYHSIIVNQPVSVTGSGGGLTLTTNDGGTGGVFSFGTQGNVTFWSLSDHLKINNKIYTLVNTIAVLASDIAANSKGHYALAANYDATPDGTYTAAPVPTIFTGIFEGLGNTISNLTIDTSGLTGLFAEGLFAEVDSPGIVENLGLSNASVKSPFEAGLLMGILKGSLFGDHVSGSVAAPTAGGLAGQNSVGRISHSFSTAAVSGKKRCLVGGLVGLISGGNVDNSYATGAVTGGVNANVGGFAGYIQGGSVAQSYATGTVTGGEKARIGGFVGANESNDGTQGLIDDYATGSVSGGVNAKVGSFVGQNDNGAKLANSYATGGVSGGTGSLIGGFVGNDLSSGVISESYWDTTSSGVTNLSQGAGNISNDAGIAGMTTSQLQSGLPAGLDPSIWAENSSINNGLPYLLANPPPP